MSTGGTAKTHTSVVGISYSLEHFQAFLEVRDGSSQVTGVRQDRIAQPQVHVAQRPQIVPLFGLPFEIVEPPLRLLDIPVLKDIGRHKRAVRRSEILRVR